MLISELTFPHLRAAEDARLDQQLERRRVALERRAEVGSRSARTADDSIERMSRRPHETKRSAVARPA
ncbi:hypothetical protein [Agromyces humatus]|uniref:hypothetical protein n=1 Tax=Agromyces humatus TaxID=279573 RepID=UPI001E4FBD03|nr:hypothetical protein [Agromyces humatus]